jgi:hypothetical protein
MLTVDAFGEAVEGGGDVAFDAAVPAEEPEQAAASASTAIPARSDRIPNVTPGYRLRLEWWFPYARHMTKDRTTTRPERRIGSIR